MRRSGTLSAKQRKKYRKRRERNSQNDFGRANLCLETLEQRVLLDAAFIYNAPVDTPLDLTLRVNGDQLELVETTDPTDVKLTQLLSGVSNVVITGTDTENDLLTIDFSNPILKGISYQGGTGGNDSLKLTGGSFTQVTYDATGSDSGSISLDSEAVSYAGLEPVTDTTTADHRTFNFTDQGETIRLIDDGIASNNISIIDSGGTGAFESIAFLSPSVSLTVNAGSGSDILIHESLDDLFAASVSLRGEGDNDTFTITPGAAMTLEGGPGVDALQIDAAGREVAHNDTTHTYTVAGFGAVIFSDFNATFDSVEVSNDFGEQILSGLEALAVFGGAVGNMIEFQGPIPLMDAAVGKNLDTLVEIGAVLDDLFSDLQTNLLGVHPDLLNVTTTTVQIFLSSWSPTISGGADLGNITLKTRVATDVSTGNELSLHLQFTTQRVSNALLDETNISELSGGNLETTLADLEGRFDLHSELSVDVTFGVDLAEAAQDKFFLEVTDMTASATTGGAVPFLLDFDLQVGVLEAAVTNATINYDVSAQVNFPGGKIRRDQLVTGTNDSVDPTTLVTTTANGDVTASLPVTVEGITVSGGTLNGTIVIGGAAENFYHPQTSRPGVSMPRDLRNFTLITPDSLIEGLLKMGPWLDGVSNSSIYDVQIPLVQEQTIGSLLDFEAALAMGATDYLQTNGLANFGTLQEMLNTVNAVNVSDITVSMVAAYDITTEELTFRLNLTHAQPVVNDALALNRDYETATVSNAQFTPGGIEITTDNPHGLKDGDVVLIKDVGGTDPANGQYTIDVLNTTTVLLIDSLTAAQYNDIQSQNSNLNYD
ncbi:MAG: LEPR-XLL domain-containing protein, partial [Planctomycetes bacterium]|nr:LEPR-XLL domain-containing protein [Planctomycetota bacterium]